MAIPAMLIYFVRRRHDVPFHWMFLMFGTFIIACGFTHFFDIWTFYDPIYRFWGVVKAFTAVVSIATVVALMPVIPKALALPGLAAVNEKLISEIREREGAEERSRRDEQRFRSIIGTALDAVVTIDAAGVITDWNAQAEAIFGWPRDEAIGQTLTSTIIPPAYHEAHRNGLRHFLDTGVGPVLNQRIEITALHRDGHEFPIELAITPIAVGSTFSFSAFVRDITERKCAEETRSRLATIVENSEDAIISMSMDCMIQTWNAGAERLYGYTAEEAIGQPIHMLIPPEHVEEEHDVVARVQQGKRVEPFETVRMAKDGRQINVSISVSPISDASGKIVGAAKTARDITERKRAEERLRLIVEAAPSAMLMVNREGVIVLVNSLTEKYFGYTREELLAKPVEMLVPPRFREKHPEYRAGFFASPEMRRMGIGRDLFGLRKDGSEFPIEIGLNPIQTEDGIMVLSAIVDITERKRGEERLRDSVAAVAFANESLRSANEELRRHNVELDEFSFIASHDLQEPLRKIVAFGDLLPKDLGSEIPEAAQQDLGFITDAAKRMRVLIQDLLALSRAGRTALNREPVSLNDCVENVMVALSDRIEKTKAEITRDELPDVLGDSTQLTQLYQNLIANALKFSEPGQRPEIRLTCEQKEGERVLGVRDNGIGIKPEYHEQIFAPFKRLHGRDKFEGTGIGLSICRKAVERHGGRIWVESQPGQGAHFRFTLNAVSENTTWLREPESRPSSSSPRMTPAIKS